MPEISNQDILDELRESRIESNAARADVLEHLERINGTLGEHDERMDTHDKRFQPLENTQKIWARLVNAAVAAAVGVVIAVVTFLLVGCTLPPITTTPEARPSETPSNAPTLTGVVDTPTATQTPTDSSQLPETLTPVIVVTLDSTPTPIGSELPTPGATPLGAEFWPAWWMGYQRFEFTAGSSSIYIRDCAAITCNIVGGISARQIVEVSCTFHTVGGNMWGDPEELCYGNDWFAIEYGGVVLGTLEPIP